MWQNNEYKCPEREPCGEAPACVTGRKGEKCDQADVTPCPGVKDLHVQITMSFV